MAQPLIQEIDELTAHLELSPDEISMLRTVTEKYPMAIPEHYLSLVDPGDPDDPIKRMCVPRREELQGGGMLDTSGEQSNTKMTGVQHKYAPTVLFLATNTCLMYCRHCFRKRMVGLTEEEMLRTFDAAYNYVKEHQEVTNVLITGGDPLTIPPHLLDELLGSLSTIEHLRFIRIGSRIPVVDPGQLTGNSGLLQVLERHNRKKTLYFVTQFNHPRELCDTAQEAIQCLLDRHILVSNQTVLLRGINDDPDTLSTLMQDLTRHRILPYYLFQCRPVKGVADHFQVPLLEGIRISERARERLNGHEKRFRYCMSHVSGKVEILGTVSGNEVLFKYHMAKDPADHGRIFTRTVTADQCWL